MAETIPTPPPVIYEPTARLVYSDLGLAELFAATATKNGLVAELVHPDDVAALIGDYLRSIDTNHVRLTDSALLRGLQLADQLKANHFDVSDPQPAGLDHTAQPHDLVTGCLAAVAETGSIAFHGSCGSSTPASSIVIVEPRDLVADLIDLLEQFRLPPTDLTLVSGPSQIRVFVLH